MRRPSIRAGLLLVFFLCCCAVPLIARSSKTKAQSNISAVSDTASLNANRVWMYFNSRGSLEYEYNKGYGGGFWLPDRRGRGYADVVLFDAGVGLIGKVNGALRLGLTQWGSSYAPGPIIGGKPALWARPQDSTRYRPYKISRGDTTSTNPDYAEWPADLGAPTDLLGRPKLYGDQTIWMVYNNADSTRRPYEWFTSAPFPHAALEIHQLAYSRQSTLCDSMALLANTAFFEWTIINKEPVPIDSAYAILWTDIDFANNINVPAVDTLRQLPYCWDADTPGSVSSPMAVGYLPLAGPIIPSPGDTALFRGSKRAGYRNLRMTSFWPILDDGGIDSGKYFFPASSTERLWNVARGFDKDGLPLVDSTSGMITKFPYNGDPVTGTGWVWKRGEGIGGGAGFYVFFGPFRMAPGDTQWLQAALVPARGTDHFDAIRVLRQHAEELQAMSYDSILSAHFAHILCTEPPLPTAAWLIQNYPNPFNGFTTIGYGLPEPSHVTLKIFNILGQEISTLIDGDKTSGFYTVRLDAAGLASGVYFYQLQTPRSILTRKLMLLR